jgi:hypothetical protein
MTEKQFDEFFRKKLGNHSSEVPGDMWQRIKQKKDKDRTFIILLLLLLLITGGSTTYFIFSGKENVNGNIALSQKNANKNSSNETSKNQNKKHETINTRNDTIGLDQNKNSISSDETFTNRESNSSKNEAAKLVNNKNDLKNSIEEDKNKVELNNLNISNFSQPNVSAKYDSLRDDLSNHSIQPGEEVAIMKEDQKKSMLQNDSAKEEKKNVQIAKTKSHNQSSIINNIFLEAYASPDIPVSHTAGNSSYLQHKDSTSKMQLSYTFGLRVGALLGEHFIVRTGVQYSEVNERFNYTKKNATRTIPVVVQRTLPDANGIERTVLDTSNLIQVGSQYKLNYNHYKSFDVPVLVGYETSGDRLKASFNTGVILNIKTTYKGDILDGSLNAVDINSNNFYKNTTGVSVYFGLGLSTKLNNNFQLFTEPYIKYRLSNMTRTYQQFTQKINVGGLSLGLRYNF